MKIIKNSRSAIYGMAILLFTLISTGFMLSDRGNLTSGDSMNHHENMVENNSAALNFTESQDKSVFVEDGDTLVVKSTGTDLSYDITEIRAKAGSTITIRYENTSNMPHNIVFVNERSDIQPVGVAALQARETDYIPQDEELQSRILGYTALAKPNFTEEVTITVPEPGTYPYICTYPGHFTMMQGDLISE